MEIFKVKDLNFTYATAKEPALKDISFEVNAGEFVTVCGATGSGKSTLLRLLKRELAPVGDVSGRILFEGRDLQGLTARESAGKIGFVMQNPEQQIVTDKVWHELAFGLENLGVESEVIRRRVAEMASYFGIESWFEKSVTELSGGQKQLLNLASVMVMQPEVLLLDEPTAQLDPIAAADFISTVSKLNRDTGLSVVITEHRLENVIPVSDRLLALDRGEVIAFGETRETVEKISENERVLYGMPAAVRLFAGLKASGNFKVSENFNATEKLKVNGKLKETWNLKKTGNPKETGNCPLDVCEGRRFIEENFKNEVKSLPKTERIRDREKALEFKEVCFRYEKDLPDAVRSMSFEVRRREIFCLLGGNGSGKSTTLSLAAGICKAWAGEIRIFGKKLKEYKAGTLYNECVAMLPQDVQTLFIADTVKEELKEVGFEPEMLPFDFKPLTDRHPYDLSGGEQQMLGLAKAIAARPKLLLLDEPTKGLDACAKKEFASVLRSLRDSGLTILLVTHDVEFAAAVADRCALVFRGEVTSEGENHEFFAGNNFYTTAINRMTRGFYDGILRVREAEEIIRLNGCDKE